VTETPLAAAMSTMVVFLIFDRRATMNLPCLQIHHAGLTGIMDASFLRFYTMQPHTKLVVWFTISGVEPSRSTL
jgi:hypothetical protein